MDSSLVCLSYLLVPTSFLRSCFILPFCNTRSYFFGPHFYYPSACPRLRGRLFFSLLRPSMPASRSFPLDISECIYSNATLARSSGSCGAFQTFGALFRSLPHKFFRFVFSKNDAPAFRSFPLFSDSEWLAEHVSEHFFKFCVPFAPRFSEKSATVHGFCISL